MHESFYFFICISDNRSSKKVGPKGPVALRKPLISRRSSESSTTDPKEEERKCPLSDCDSSGHLSGKYDTHFTVEGCPMYHNLSSAQCKVRSKCICLETNVKSSSSSTLGTIKFLRSV